MLATLLFAPVVFCLIALSHLHSASAFQTKLLPVSRTLYRSPPATKLDVTPELHDSILAPMEPLVRSTSIIVSSEGESWRQYVPLAVSCAVIIDILLGSPLANLALGPMRRASEKGAGGDSDGDSDGGGGGSLFSALSGNFDSGSGVVDSGRGKERVDSEAIAQAALDKAMGTLELKRFLEENKTDEQRYEEVRKKIDQQMNELDD
mmetsp:Transcript_11091/g.19357  ORF Transcript_11091/g.19357 Transcript_11091/m.19357 type:complete len:206 (+) Transcript_11091:142-759(+)